jgi:YD repeat-containing protein
MKSSKVFVIGAHLAALLFLAWPRAEASNIAYSYDPAGRLVAADYGGGKSTSYAYDNAGNLLLWAQPAPAILVSRLAAGQINLFWPAAPSGFLLYSSRSLGVGASWNISGAIQFQAGDLIVVTQAVGALNTFYQLKK